MTAYKNEKYKTKRGGYSLLLQASVWVNADVLLHLRMNVCDKYIFFFWSAPEKHSEFCLTEIKIHAENALNDLFGVLWTASRGRCLHIE